MESARIQRGFDRAKILRIQNYLATHPLGTEDVTVHHYNARLDMLVQAYASFNQSHKVLTSYIQIDNAEELQINENYYDQVKEMFHKLEKELLRHISVLDSPVPTNECNPVLEYTTGLVLQPTIRKSYEENTIPSFSGDFRDWSSFFNIFSSLIHLNSHLPDVVKFVYLKSSLKGEALSYIQHYSITNYNYSAAWNKLISRYGKQTSNIQSIVLQTPRNVVSGSIQPKSSSCYVPAIFNHHFSNSTSSNHNKSSDQTNTVHNQVSKSSHCTVCSGGHAVHQCSRFKKLNSSSRRDLVRKNNLCFNCLYSTHSVAECKTKSSCNLCNNRHHTLIHTDSSVSDLISSPLNSSSYETFSNPHSTLATVNISSTRCSTMNNSLTIETVNDLENFSSLPVQTIPLTESLNYDDAFHNNLVLEPSIHNDSTLIIYNQTETIENMPLSSQRDTKNDYSMYYQSLDIFSTILYHREESSIQLSRNIISSARKWFIVFANRNSTVISSVLANWKKGDVKQSLLDTNSSLGLSALLTFAIKCPTNSSIVHQFHSQWINNYYIMQENDFNV